MKSLLLGLAYWAGSVVEALDVSCAPGGNFDMRYWNLQLPIGSVGSPTTISSSQLQGCSGYQNYNYFFTESGDAALVMKVPGSPDSAGCVTTPNSKHCRTELRELDPNTGRSASWDPYEPVNRLSARLSCGTTGDGTGTVVGQIHIDDTISSKPVAELYYSANGDLTMGVGQTRAGGDQIRTYVTNIPPGQVFTYEIRYESNVLSLVINGGSPKIFSTYQLNAPRSYFKAGNYLQGTTPSSVHFFEINVRHDSTPIAYPWPPASATGTRTGIGPFNIIQAIDRTLTSAPPSSSTGSASCDSALEIASDNTVSLKLFSGSSCCSLVETIKMGTLESCHNADADFGSFIEAVGQNMFDRGIHVVTYEGRDCTGTSQESKLTNSRQCFTNSRSLSAPFKSFKISASGSTTSCAVSQPTAVAASNVALNLFSDSGCCTQSQSIKMGTLDSCHDANNLPDGFKSFTQAVGQDMFGKGTQIVTYAGQGCTGTATITKLTNAATCYESNNFINTPFLSFKIVNTDALLECTTPRQPENNSNDTVTVSLFGDVACCSTPVETSKIGKFGVCHNANAAFKGVTQAAGQNTFGRNIHIRRYASRDCKDSTWEQISLSNNNKCYIGSGQYQSYMISDDAGGSGSSTSTCNSTPPKKKSDTTVVLELFKESSCCTPVETIAIGNLDVCHNADASFQALKQAVGQNMFGRGIHIQLFESRDCANKAFVQTDLSNKDVCTHGSETYRSFRIASGATSNTTPSCNSIGPASLVPTSDDSMRLLLHSDSSCCNPMIMWELHIPNSGDVGCLTPDSRFSSLSQGVGQNLFGQGIHVYMFADKNCAGDGYWALDLSNNGKCVI
ncbi:alginate lyase-domain-containing protein, partial [Staphylotrichum tortipilum]